MKLKSIYLVSMALLAGVFAACNDNDVENFDNQVYINGSVTTFTLPTTSRLPRNKCIDLHEAEILTAWEKAPKGEKIDKIEPLK